jgi:hypothetical protein
MGLPDGPEAWPQACPPAEDAVPSVDTVENLLLGDGIELYAVAEFS